MWSQQIIVAFLCTFLAWQQVAAVVNNGQTTKVEESQKSSVANAENTNSNIKKDAESASTEEKANRREAPLVDTYGPPLSGPTDTYLPSGTGNINLPVPVYGVPDAPTNNIVYPAPPPDIPPPVSLPSASYGLPLISTNFGGPIIASVSTAYLPAQTNNFGASSIKFESPSLLPPKFSGSSHGPKPIYGPPRPQYGPPRKPQFTSKYPSKFPNKGGFGIYKQTKPLSTYGPPSGYFKDNYSPSKFNFNFKGHNNLFSNNINSFSQNSFSTQSSLGGHALLTQYGVPNVGYSIPNVGYGIPNVGIESHITNLNLNTNDQTVSSQYGAPDISVQVIPSDIGHGSHSVSTQYGPPGGDQVLGPPKPHYGPPQPSPHPKPPHPGAPAPPTPPDIKYDGWQPIPGLVSRVPTTTYGAPPTGQGHGSGDLGFNKDLLPPPVEFHDHHQQGTSGFGSVALSNTYNDKQVGISDSYGAPLNTVTGSGGIVSSSGDEVHGQHLSHSGSLDINLGQNVNAVKSIGIEIYPSGSGSAGHGQGSGGYNLNLADTYSAPPLNSFSAGGPYAAAHSYNSLGNTGSSLGFGSFNTFKTHNSFNSHNNKVHGYKGIGISSGSGRGLIPPSGFYGVPPSGHYGTPLFSNTQHPPPLNALKINPPRHPVIHREPVPTNVFDSIGKGIYKHHSHGSSSTHSFGSTYLPPPVPDISKPSHGRAPPLPSTLYSLPDSHSSISFQNFAHGSNSAGLLQQNLNLNVNGVNSALSSYNVPLNIVDGSYNLPQAHTGTNSHLGGEVVGLDLSHPALTIDLTQSNGVKNSFATASDCNLHKTQSLPSLSYGVPSINSYTASLSSLTTNIGGAQRHVNSGPIVDISYEVTEPQGHIHDSYDLNVAHSQKVSSATKINSINEEKSEGKAYGKTVAKSFGPQSELLQSQSIDLNNINLQGALGSYTLQIQSADGGRSEVPHDQVLNDELLQSILAAIEQPHKNSQSIIKFQKSLEKQNFVTNETISSVVDKVTDAEIEHSGLQPLQYVVEPSNEVHTNVTETVENVQEGDHESNLRLLQDNGIALYFSNKQRSKKDTSNASLENKKSSKTSDSNSH